MKGTARHNKLDFFLHLHLFGYTVTNISDLGCLSQCCSALSVGDRNVSLLRHRHVPSVTASPGGIHRQHRDGPVFAPTPGVIVFALSRLSFKAPLKCF